MTDNEKRCVKPALVNATGCLCVHDAANATRLILSMDVTHFKNLRPLGLLIHKTQDMNVFHTRGQIIEALQEKFDEACLRWVA